MFFKSLKQVQEESKSDTGVKIFQIWSGGIDELWLRCNLTNGTNHACRGVEDRSIVPAVNFPGKTVAPLGSGFISGPGEIFVSGPPEYLKVPDYQICLQLYKVGASQVSEYCLPEAKPQNCPVLSWNQLGRVFTGIGCKPQTSNTNVKVSTKQSIISKNTAD